MKTQIISPTHLRALVGAEHYTGRTVGAASVWGVGVFVVKHHPSGTHMQAEPIACEQVTHYHKLLRKTAPHVDLFLMAPGKPKPYAVRRALADIGAIKTWTPPEEEKEREDTRKKLGYDLDEVIQFGKYSREGQALTIRDIMRLQPGYMRWCVETFGEDFLSESALRSWREQEPKPARAT